jgi:DNA polymerase V
MEQFDRLYAETTRPDVAIRRINIGVGNLVPEEFATFDLFTDYEALGKERKLQEAVLAVKGKFGRNLLMKGTSLKQGATGRERNEQVGGHRG